MEALMKGTPMSTTWPDIGRKLEARERYLASCNAILLEVFNATQDQCEGFRKYFLDFWEEFNDDGAHFFVLHDHQLYAVARYLGIAYRDADKKFDAFSEADRRILLGMA